MQEVFIFAAIEYQLTLVLANQTFRVECALGKI